MKRSSLLVLMLFCLCAGQVFAQDASYGTKIYTKQGGEDLYVTSGGTLHVTSGGTLDVGSGAALTLTSSAVFEGSTADAYETTLSVTDPTADRTVTIPDAGGAVLLSAAGVADTASAISGGSGSFIFEGSTADGFELTLDSADPAADVTVTIPAARTGTLALIGAGASPAATCTAGELWIDTDETVDTNCTTTNDNSLCLCVASNTWTQLNNN